VNKTIVKGKILNSLKINYYLILIPDTKLSFFSITKDRKLAGNLKENSDYIAQLTDKML